MSSRRRPWVGPAVVVLGVFALLGGAGFLHVLVTMAALWWLLTRTGSRGRHAATGTPRAAPHRTQQTTPSASWPVLPAAAGAAAVWYVTRDSEAALIDEEDEADSLEEVDDVSAVGWCTPAEDAAATPSCDGWGGYGGGGTWGDDFGGYGGGGEWGDSDDFGGYGGGGDWGDD